MSDKINDGGPAFPAQELTQSYATEAMNHGMTLRDYFAAKVLQGFIAKGQDHYDGNGDAERFASLAYEYADVMLKERGSK